MATTTPVRSVAFKVETDREDDGRWIAEVPELPGVLVYGDSKEDAVSKATALALRVVADRIDDGTMALCSVTFTPIEHVA